MNTRDSVWQRASRTLPLFHRSTRSSIARSAATLLLACGVACTACSNDKPKPAPVVDLQPVAAPANLAADIFVPTPDTTYQAIRTKLGGPLALLPATFPAVYVTMLGLPPQLLEQIDGNLPAYGVMTDDGTRLASVMGVHVREGARVIELLTGGPDAKYSARVDAGGVTVLEPKPNTTARAAALGVVGNYFVTGENVDDLVRCGPYVARTLPMRPAEKGSLVVVASRSALSGPAAKRVQESWAAFRKAREVEDQKLRAEHGGKAPDFADPTAALTDIDGKVSRVATLLRDLETARIGIDIDDAGVHARLTMQPAAGSGAATQEFSAMVTGDTAPLLALPKSTVLALLMRDTIEVRKQSVADQVKSIGGLFGDRIKPEESKKAEDALFAWAQGRGDWMAAALDVNPAGKVFLVDGALADSAQFDASIRSFMALPGIPAFKNPIETHVGKLTFGKPATLDGTVFVHVKRDPASKDSKIEKSEFDVAWRAQDKAPSFNFVVSQDAKGWFKQRSLEPAQTLAARQDVAVALKALGNDVAFAFFLEPARLLAGITMREQRGDVPAAPVLFTYGGGKAAGWLRLDLSNEAARELLKMATRR